MRRGHSGIGVRRRQGKSGNDFVHGKASKDVRANECVLSTYTVQEANCWNAEDAHRLPSYAVTNLLISTSVVGY